jgi:hypothetical protein
VSTPDPAIPDASYTALFAFVEDRTRVSPEATIRAVAGPMIAAELRASAERLRAMTDGPVDEHRYGLRAAAGLLALRAREYAPEEAP